MSIFDSFLEVAGNLGFLVGNNDRRRARARKEKRCWGPEHDGLAVSVAASNLEPGPDESLRIEVALLNSSGEAKHLSVGAWLTFFPFTIWQPDNSSAQLSNFGRRQTEAALAVPARQVVLQSGDVLEADIPVGALYDWKQKGIYRITGKCLATRAISNELEIRI